MTMDHQADPEESIKHGIVRPASHERCSRQRHEPRRKQPLERPVIRAVRTIRGRECRGVVHGALVDRYRIARARMEGHAALVPESCGRAKKVRTTAWNVHRIRVRLPHCICHVFPTAFERREACGKGRREERSSSDAFGRNDELGTLVAHERTLEYERRDRPLRERLRDVAVDERAGDECGGHGGRGGRGGRCAGADAPRPPLRRPVCFRSQTANHSSCFSSLPPPPTSTPWRAKATRKDKGQRWNDTTFTIFTHEFGRTIYEEDKGGELLQPCTSTVFLSNDAI